ncbi:RlpA-like double-psi beta-barrel domain-containing protein [Plantactinospora sonchi]|uniref:Secreted protein n=1 Tax=Plantactinospora sonchi TaxID=1544735 RepID=A0ABU7RUC8_9ACTN
MAATALLGGALAAGTGLGNAGENCTGLDTALRNNLNFIAEQQANPDALSADRIANRQAVVDLIQQRRATAGCTADVRADAPAAPAAPPEAGPGEQPPKAPADPDGDDGAGSDNSGGNGSNSGSSGTGEVVCKGSTVTLFNEDAGPAASSGVFPVGTKLKVTNLDNNKSVTVTVTSPSGSCVLLNNAAFEQVREPGKFVIRRPVVERLGG